MLKKLDKAQTVEAEIIETSPPGKKDKGNKGVITKPQFGVLYLTLQGTSPYMQARFSEKAKTLMREKMEEGSRSRKRRPHGARDFEADFLGAMYKLPDGGHGIPAGAFRAAAISACRLVGFRMTLAKLSIFIEADGLDQIDSTPLVRLTGKPESNEMPVRNATGVADLRVRPLWREWEVKLRCRFDLEQFSAIDILNLFLRIGMQVGIGEGRPDSKESNGLGFGLFTVADYSHSTE